jgi:flagellar basal body-associated protein FliL
MEKKKLNIKVKIAVGIIIFIVALFIGSFVYYKQGIIF